MEYNKILITGGCGFLGQHLTKDLLEHFPRVRIKLLDIRANPNPLFDFNENPNVEIALEKDICNYDSIKNEFDNIDLVIHLAGLVSFSVKDKDLLQNVNVQGTKNILKALQENNIENFIHISSVAALGYNNDENKPVNEQFEFDWNIAVKRKKYYMLTKHLADLEVQKQIRKGLNAIICYPGLMLGPGDRTNSPKLINAIKKGKIPFNMPGGTNIIDVRDVSRGIVTALEKNITNGDYLLSGDNLTFKNVNETIAKILSAKAPKLTLPGFLNNFLFRILLFVESMAKNKLSLTADNLDSAFKFRYFDNTKAREQLLWQPKINFEKTIKDTIEWMNQNDFF